MRRFLFLFASGWLGVAAWAETPAVPPASAPAPAAAAPHVMVDDPDHANLAAPKSPQITSRPVYTLKDCLDLSLRQNPDILIAKKNIEAAGGGLTVARAAFLPHLAVNGLAQRDLRNELTLENSDPTLRNEDYYVTVQVTESLYSGGANTSRMKIARLAHSTRMLEYQTVIDATILKVRLAYYALLLSQSNIEVQRQAIDLLDRQLGAEQDRLSAGLTSRTSVLRAQVSRANALPGLLASENALTNGYVQLALLLNIPYKPGQSEAPFEVTGSLGYEPRAYNLADCLRKATSARPELKARENDIESQEKQLVVDRSAILPRVNLFAGYDVTSEQSRDSLHPFEDGYVAGVSGTWDIFDGLETFGKMKSTRAKMQAAIATRDQTRVQIEADVRQAFNQLAQASQTVESQNQNVVLARESYVLANASYEAGLATQLDVLQSRVDLTTAQTTEFQARYDYLSATAQLQRALSGQFQIVNDVLPPSTRATEPIPAGEPRKPEPGQGQGQNPGPDASGAAAPAPAALPPPLAPLPSPSMPADSGAGTVSPMAPPAEPPLPSGPMPSPATAPLGVPPPVTPPGSPYPSSGPNSSSQDAPRSSNQASLADGKMPPLPR